MKKKILVRAPALTQSGYGEQARFALRSLRSREDIFDIYLHPITWGQTGWVFEDTEERRWMDSIIEKAAKLEREGGSYDMSLQVTIPNEWQKICPVNVGYTAGIEATRIAPQWVEKSMVVDKIITTSNHAKHGFDNTFYEATNEQTGEVIKDFRCTTPSEAVNYAARDLPSEKVDLDLDYEFNFLCMSQWSIRKNLENTIIWFMEEFKNDEVGLVLKVNHANNSNMDKVNMRNTLKSLLNNFKDRKCKIYLIHGDMTSEEILGLYENPKIKALINIAHGEGFGLPMFEAAQKGLPIVTTAWGGQVDFLYVPTKDKKRNKVYNKAHFSSVDYVLKPIPEQAVWDGVLIRDTMWCYPHRGNFKAKIRDLYKNYGPYKKMANTLKKHVLKEFSEENQYKKFVDACLSALPDVNYEADVDELFDKMVKNKVVNER